MYFTKSHTVYFSLPFCSIYFAKYSSFVYIPFFNSLIKNKNNYKGNCSEFKKVAVLYLQIIFYNLILFTTYIPSQIGNYSTISALFNKTQNFVYIVYK